MPRPRRGAWIYTPEHSASRAQGNAQTLGDDTCIGYQVLLDNTRDAGRRTVRSQLSLSLSLVHTCVRIVQSRVARVLLCSYRILSLCVWLKLLRRKTHHTSTMYSYICSKHGSRASVHNFQMFGFPDQGSDARETMQIFVKTWTHKTSLYTWTLPTP